MRRTSGGARPQRLRDEGEGEGEDEGKGVEEGVEEGKEGVEVRVAPVKSPRRLIVDEEEGKGEVRGSAVAAASGPTVEELQAEVRALRRQLARYEPAEGEDEQDL